ncbi:MAG: toll/interleukin-1 receptor domain-containing protein [Bdellovibrionales bacterium]|nr:toll/interleukin-1 receptor domain-containing protein [Bdellovibrionales bacterium]
MPQETRDLIFVSYRHRDKAWLEKLLIFLKPYQRKGQLTVWADPYIEVGDVWKREIDHALPRAKVGLLMVSAHFLDSDFIMKHEVPPLEEAAGKGYRHMFCVTVSSGPVEPTRLNKYQWARPPQEPLDLLPEAEQNAALVGISKTLVEIFQKIGNPLPSTSGQVGVISSSPIEIQPIADTPSPVPLRMFPRPVNLNQEKRLPLACCMACPPNVRTSFQEGPEELDRLKTSLLEELNAAVGLTGKITRLGVHGQGDIGKTVLAIALANDEEVRRAFPDGGLYSSTTCLASCSLSR